MGIDDIILRIDKVGLKVLSHERVNNCAEKLTISNGSVINVFDTGKINFQGKNADNTKALLERDTTEGQTNRKVFVVYGHDNVARTQLEAMLRRWDLEPLILDQLPSAGSTVIEKLEEYTKQVQFGIVLATPDDIGYARKDGDTKAKGRVRQNVVLELGMLLAKIGRNRVAILLKNQEDFERPSDIEGLIYIPFNENVEEAKVSLAKEMNGHHYKIDIANL